MIKNDMLVNLLKLQALEPIVTSMRKKGVIIRRANPWEITAVRKFVQREFTVGWADEISVGFARQPVSVFIAIRDGKVIGIAGYECTHRDYFGPTGVAKAE